MNKEDFEKLRLAGKQTAELMKYAKTIVKKGIPLMEIAEKTEEYALKKGYKFAFPINLCMNEITAHYCPIDNELKAEGLLKIDLGCCVDGFCGDKAVTLDLTDDKRHSKVLEASKEALENAINLIKEKAEKGLEINEIGREINKTIESKGFSSIKNLSGHEIKQYNLHAGLTIPNYDNNNSNKLKEGVYAIEPFATYGEGIVKDYNSSNVFILKDLRPVRGKAREILKFIEEEYKTLPFCSRWIIKKFGSSAVLALRQLEKEDILHHFPQLVEKTGKPVSQFEHTISFFNGKVEVLTED